MEEVIKTSEKVPLPADVEALHQTLVDRQQWAKTLATYVNNVVQPNPGE